jgi:P-type E1-E2 ATPase
VELVRTAQASKAPLQRLADRVAVWFTPVTLLACGAAWYWSGDPDRVLAVLVVATPCPLILATPVAIIGGINRAAKRRIIMRHGGALEAIAAVNAVVFDKTGTLTLGQPAVASIEVLGPWTQESLLHLAATVEEGAGHPLARSLVAAARARGIAPGRATAVQESPGRGVSGMAEGRHVTVGSLSLIRERAPGAADALDHLRNGRAGLHAYVAVDGEAAGQVLFADQPRPACATCSTGCGPRDWSGRCCSRATTPTPRGASGEPSGWRRRRAISCRPTRWPSSSASAARAFGS